MLNPFAACCCCRRPHLQGTSAAGLYTSNSNYDGVLVETSGSLSVSPPCLHAPPA